MAYQRFGTREVLFKIETTEGVDAVPTAASNAFLTFNAAIEWQADTAKRMSDKPYFTAEDEIETGDRIKLTFEADLLGASTPGTSSPISPLLQCCGFAEVLSPTTVSAPTGFTVTPVASGGTFTAATYYWKITFTNLGGETVGSTEQSGAIVASGSANLAWTAGGAGVTGVNVYRGTAAGAENVLVASLAGSAVSYTDTGIAGTAGSPPAANGTAYSQYTPVTSSIVSGTFYFYQGDKQFKVTGARGDIQFDRSPSAFGKMTFTFTGTVDGTANPFQGVAPTPTLTAFRAAPVITPANWLVSANGVHVECVKHVLNLGNAVNYIPTSENGRVLITDRKPSGTLSILLPDITVFNPWLLAQNRTKIVLSDNLTAGVSLSSTINLPTVQLMKPKKFTDLKGGIQVDIPYIPYPNVGNDELNIVVS